MTDGQRLALKLDLDPGADPIKGLLTAADGQAQEFVGWLGLAGAIEGLLMPPGRVRAEKTAGNDTRTAAGLGKSEGVCDEDQDV